MKRYLLLMIFLLLLSPCAMAQENPKLIGEVEFFGSSGIDLNKLRAALPFHEKESFSSETFMEKTEQAGAAVKRVTGRWPTDLANVCCDAEGNRIIFIGLSGTAIRNNPAPRGNARLPAHVLELYERFIKVTMEGVQKGSFAEDDSKGYSLAEYPPMRAVQLEMRAYAVEHGALLRKALATSADDKQRIAAAELLGYAQQSKSQLAALVRATQDSNGTVRNNATRALIVLARSSTKIAGQIPAAGFIELLLSGTWTDLNKAGNLLSFITKSREAKTLRQLRRREVLERLIEMARWRSHGEAARLMLGRVAGINESRLEQLVMAGQVEVIVNEALR
jgi:HEAT repeats